MKNLSTEQILILSKKIIEAESENLSAFCFFHVKSDLSKLTGFIVDFREEQILLESKMKHRFSDSHYVQYLPLATKNVWIIKEVMEVVDGKTGKQILKIFLEIADVDYLPSKEIFATDEDKKRIKKLLEINGLTDKKTYINSKGSFVKLLDVVVEEFQSHLTNSPKNPWKILIKEDGFKVKLKVESLENEEEKWVEKFYFFRLPLDESDVKKRIEEMDLLEIDLPEEDFEKRSENIALNGLFSTEVSKMIGDDDVGDDNTNNQLVGFASKEHLEAIVSKVGEQINTANLIERGVRREIKKTTNNIELEKRKVMRLVQEKMNSLEAVRASLNAAVVEMNKKIRRINKLIASIEIYAGINEDLVQISEGDISNSTTLFLRQRTVFLDEEIALWEEQGLVWDKIEEFDEWLINTKKYKEILPEEKCIVMSRVRRIDVSYPWIECPWSRGSAEAEANKTLILIRNGDNIYRIFTEHISAWQRLFPKKDELKEMFENMSRGDGASENKYFSYNKNFLLIHGLLSRTNILDPMPMGFNIMKPETYGDSVVYVYDEENVLGENKESFSEILSKVNSETTVGSLILLSFENLSSNKRFSSKDWEDRFNIYWANDYQRPSLPNTGVYKVKASKKELRSRNRIEMSVDEFRNTKDYLTEKMIDVRMYDSKVVFFYPWDDGEIFKTIEKDSMRISYKQTHRTYLSFEEALEDRDTKGNWTSFLIEKSDDFFINIDGLSLDDIERLLQDKSLRNQYLYVFPLLIRLRAELRKNMENEKSFIDSMSHRLSFETNVPKDKVLKAVADAVVWYKEKLPVKTKRPLPIKGLSVGKAWELVELQAKRTLKKQKLINEDVSGAKVGNKKTFVYKDFAAKIQINFTSLNQTKKEFVDGIIESTSPFFPHSDHQIPANVIRRMRNMTKKHIWDKTEVSKSLLKDVVFNIEVTNF